MANYHTWWCLPDGTRVMKGIDWGKSMLEDFIAPQRFSAAIQNWRGIVGSDASSSNKRSDSMTMLYAGISAVHNIDQLHEWLSQFPRVNSSGQRYMALDGDLSIRTFTIEEHIKEIERHVINNAGRIIFVRVMTERGEDSYYTRLFFVNPHTIPTIPIHPRKANEWEEQAKRFDYESRPPVCCTPQRGMVDFDAVQNDAVCCTPSREMVGYAQGTTAEQFVRGPYHVDTDNRAAQEKIARPFREE